MAELRAQEGISAPATGRPWLQRSFEVAMLSCCNCMHACGFLQRSLGRSQHSRA